MCNLLHLSVIDLLIAPERSPGHACSQDGGVRSSKWYHRHDPDAKEVDNKSEAS